MIGTVAFSELAQSPDRWRSLLEQVQKTKSEVHIPVASAKEKEEAASLGRTLFTSEAVKQFEQAKIRAHIVLEPNEYSRALFDNFQTLASASARPSPAGAAASLPQASQQPPITVSMKGAGFGAGLGLSAFLAIEGLKNTAAAVGNPAALLTAMVLGGALLGSAVAGGVFKVTIGPEGVGIAPHA